MHYMKPNGGVWNLMGALVLLQSMVWKGNLVIFENSNISETWEATPTKIGVHAFDVSPYLHKFFELIPIN